MKPRGIIAVFIIMAGAAIFLWQTKPPGEQGPEKKTVLEKKIQVIDTAKELSTQVNMKAIQREVFMYISEYGKVPENLNQLLENAQLETEDKDAWGTPIQYKRISDECFYLLSAGNDKKFDTIDDIVLKY